MNRVLLAGWAACCMLVGSLTLAQEPTATPPGAARLAVDKTHVDLGVVRQGGIYDFAFRLSNEGDSPLILSKVSSPCSCTVTKPEKNTLAPGESILLSASFDSRGRSGLQKKAIVIESNDAQAPVMELSFEAVVEVLYRLRPGSRVFFTNKRPGETIEPVIDILAGKTGVEVEIQEINFDRGGLTFAQEAISDGDVQGQRLALTLAPAVPLGTYANIARVSLRVGQEETQVDIPVNGRVIADISVLPRMLFPADAVLPGHEIPSGRITLRSLNPEKPFAIRRIEAGSALTYSIEQDSQGTQYSIDFAVADAASPGPHAQTIVILTNNDAQPVITIPAYVNVAGAVDANPPYVYLSMRLSDTAPRSRQTVSLFSVLNQPLEILEAVSDNPYIEVVVNESASGSREREILVRLAPSTPAGEHAARVTLRTNTVGAEKLEIPVWAEISEQTQMDE